MEINSFITKPHHLLWQKRNVHFLIFHLKHYTNIISDFWFFLFLKYKLIWKEKYLNLIIEYNFNDHFVKKTIQSHDL